MSASATLLEILSSFLAAHRVAGRVTVALSGGVDSMVLLDAACAFRDAGSFAPQPDAVGAVGFSVDALHVHHGLSENADHWASFCERQCAARGVALTIVQVSVDRTDTQGQGVEGAARRARYQAFADFAGGVILSAQHADDQAETFLHQLLRGTGLGGLSAMGSERTLVSGQRVLRPFLTTSRAQIEAYADERGLEWIEDESNDDTRYTRNYLRHDVLPLIAQRFPHYRESLARAARHAAESASLNEALAKLDLRWDGTTAYADGLDHLDLTRQSNALYWWLRWQRVPPPSQSQLESWARQLFRESPSDRPHRAGGHSFVIRRTKHKLVLQASTESN